jgi:D-tyrosyl-tRNA(Tyr) deacylase
MRAVIQRVSEARVVVDGETTGQIEQGILIYLGVGRDDSEKEADALLEKICVLRIFPDEAGKMNRNVEEIGGGLLIVSQFTLRLAVTIQAQHLHEGAFPAYLHAWLHSG